MSGDPSGASRAPVVQENMLGGLLERMARGDQDALAALYDETSSVVHGLLRRMLEHSADAEEALLDVYMKAWKHAGAYSPSRGGVQPWLTMMARTIAIDRIRHRRAQPSTLGYESTGAPEFVSQAQSPEVETMDSQRRAGVRRVLAELPSQYRQVLLMAFFSGFTHSELAERLGEPLGTVKSRIRAALMRLRDLLEREKEALS
jgi:RNA polymerase sigma-70 factor (ECF subfamily)